MQVVVDQAIQPDTAPVVDPAAVPAELTLEQRISMVEDLSMLIDKWRKLQESYRNLQSFKIAVDGFSSQFILRDNNSGREFKTSNSAVVSRVMEEVRSILSEKIAEIECQIRF